LTAEFEGKKPNSFNGITVLRDINVIQVNTTPSGMSYKLIQHLLVCPKSLKPNQNIVETKATLIPRTQIYVHDYTLSWLGTSISVTRRRDLTSFIAYNTTHWW